MSRYPKRSAKLLGVQQFKMNKISGLAIMGQLQRLFIFIFQNSSKWLANWVQLAMLQKWKIKFKIGNELKLRGELELKLSDSSFKWIYESWTKWSFLNKTLNN